MTWLIITGIVVALAVVEYWVGYRCGYLAGRRSK